MNEACHTLGAHMMAISLMYCHGGAVPEKKKKKQQQQQGR
ncbi:MAG: hypothetical protein ACI8RD_012614 [Bacillariaceae sp.]|jgi:hypothetical protein